MCFKKRGIIKKTSIFLSKIHLDNELQRLMNGETDVCVYIPIREKKLHNVLWKDNSGFVLMIMGTGHQELIYSISPVFSPTDQYDSYGAQPCVWNLVLILRTLFSCTDGLKYHAELFRRTQAPCGAARMDPSTQMSYTDGTKHHVELYERTQASCWVVQTNTPPIETFLWPQNILTIGMLKVSWLFQFWSNFTRQHFCHSDKSCETLHK